MLCRGGSAEQLLHDVDQLGSGVRPDAGCTPGDVPIWTDEDAPIGLNLPQLLPIGVDVEDAVPRADDMNVDTDTCLLRGGACCLDPRFSADSGQQCEVGAIDQIEGGDQGAVAFDPGVGQMGARPGGWLVVELRIAVGGRF